MMCDCGEPEEEHDLEGSLTNNGCKGFVVRGD